jgi:RNA polymerase sigma factor (sigma-70 family)
MPGPERAERGMDESDAGLLAATARGDAEAFGRFYRRHEHQVLGYAVARCSNASDVADAVGETFLAALGAASRFRDDGGDAVPWLFGIARRVLARQRRSLARRQRLIRRLETLPSLTSAEADAVDAAIDAARLAPRLAAALAKLRRETRSYSGWSAMTGCPRRKPGRCSTLTPTRPGSGCPVPGRG